MATAKQGDTVHVHYTGRLEDGTVFDSSKGKSPIEFVLGTGHVIPGFEKAVEGLSEGEQISATIPSEDAYGLRSEELVMNVPVENFPGESTPEVGQRFEMRTPDGQKVPVTVTETNDETVEIDANHPLAGKKLEFDLELVKVD